MASITITYGGTSINSGRFTLLAFDPGEKLKTFDEVRSYAGGVAQTNVTEANLIEVNIRLLIQGASNADLRDAVSDLNTLIDAGAQTLAFNDGSGNINYSCVKSPRIRYVPDPVSTNKFWTIVDWVLYRTP